MASKEPKEEREKLDPQTKAPLLDTSGKVQTEEVEIQIPMYRVVSVFDVMEFSEGQWEQIQQAGYGYHYSSDNGAYHIMGKGTRAFAIVNEDNPLRTTELSTEQNYNQIDGILNNQPTVAQLEQDAKSGKPIALMDLLDASRWEEKQSVMEQLKTKPPQDSKKEKTAPTKGAKMER